MVSVEKRDCDTYTCPKLIGLPDMIKSSFDDLPPIVDFVVDVQNRSLKKSAGRLAAQLGAPRSSVRKSLAAALEVERSYQRELLRGLDPESAMKVVLPATDNGNGAGSGPAGRQGEATGHPLRRLESRDNRLPGRLSFPSGAAEGKRGNINIALVGHEYLIHDPFISHNLPARLERLGANVILMTQVAPEVIERELKRYPDISWSYEKELLGAASHFLGREEVDGVMMVMGFACGPDSIISEIIIREVRREDSPPFTTLVLDEHTGVAGVNTRVEAFVDLIRRSGSRT
jgi:predicted nucleotide-binding protein (sugar kinase/HSP70/actin superfamily)